MPTCYQHFEHLTMKKSTNSDLRKVYSFTQVLVVIKCWISVRNIRPSITYNYTTRVPTNNIDHENKYRIAIVDS